ncbi:MAG: hypothetical protein IKR59_10465 [Lachnospiraceae bacterium]|nr:hypothetical protein [Lachnospiraceae bacterium]
MPLLTHDYYCPEIGMASELRIFLPDTILRGEEAARGFLFLLPPQGEGGLSLLTGTKLAALCDEYRIAAVIPPCLQGCFTDMVCGYPFYRSLKYVREYLKTYYPGLSIEAGKCAAAGLGISALAALRWANEEPEHFACAGSIAGILDPAVSPQGWFSEKRLSDLFGTMQERIAKREAFLSACRSSEVKKVFLFSSQQDTGYESSVRAAEAFKNRAELRLSDGPVTMKTCSDALGEFMKYWFTAEDRNGGDC